ncbi:hypothetical protein NC651_020575 [Populus alba x Populus x berolinensis]|nr:hypothetical protein NC651_020575 [Populus alba x Populus x berolinensis]
MEQLGRPKPTRSNNKKSTLDIRAALAGSINVLEILATCLKKTRLFFEGRQYLNTLMNHSVKNGLHPIHNTWMDVPMFKS